ncbi:hypothetical protein ACI2KR_08880 [Pseudomonas luteola]
MSKKTLTLDSKEMNLFEEHLFKMYRREYGPNGYTPQMGSDGARITFALSEQKQGKTIFSIILKPEASPLDPDAISYRVEAIRRSTRHEHQKAVQGLCDAFLWGCWVGHAHNSVLISNDDLKSAGESFWIRRVSSAVNMGMVVAIAAGSGKPYRIIGQEALEEFFEMHGYTQSCVALVSPKP